MSDKNPLKLRSDEVNEILNRPPHWMIRWGIGSILSLLAGLIALSWVIQYPDVIEGRVTLSSTPPPFQLSCERSGQLQRIHFKDGDTVRKGDRIALLSNQFSQGEAECLLQAPVDGTLTFLQRVEEKQFLEAQTPLFAILPHAKTIVGQVEVTTSALGKVEAGQSVQVQLANFPYQEFGLVEGEVQSIRLIPTTDPQSRESLYQVNISLPNGLTSSYGQELKYFPQMQGNARIITDDLRLIDRILQQFSRRFGE